MPQRSDCRTNARPATPVLTARPPSGCWLSCRPSSDVEFSNTSTPAEIRLIVVRSHAVPRLVRTRMVLHLTTTVFKCAEFVAFHQNDACGVWLGSSCGQQLFYSKKLTSPKTLKSLMHNLTRSILKAVVTHMTTPWVYSIRTFVQYYEKLTPSPGKIIDFHRLRLTVRVGEHIFYVIIIIIIIIIIMTSCAACTATATLCFRPWPLTFWPWKWRPSHVWCGLLCANFSLPRPLCSRLRHNVRDRRQTDVRQTDVRRAASLNAPYP